MHHARHAYESHNGDLRPYRPRHCGGDCCTATTETGPRHLTWSVAA